jgi:hypothetical protein
MAALMMAWETRSRVHVFWVRVRYEIDRAVAASVAERTDWGNELLMDKRSRDMGTLSGPAAAF